MPRVNHFALLQFKPECTADDIELVRPRPANLPGTGWWGRLIERIAEPQLFDLNADPGEKTNLAGQHPDLVATLSQRLNVARTELGDVDRTGRGARFFDAGPRKLPVPLTQCPSPLRPNHKTPVRPPADATLRRPTRPFLPQITPGL